MINFQTYEPNKGYKRINARPRSDKRITDMKEYKRNWHLMNRDRQKTGLCIDCGKKICYNVTRCRSCSKKGLRNPHKIKKLLNEIDVSGYI